MNPLLQWSAHPLVHRLGWTLLHFLWQGAVIAALFALAQTAWPKRSGHARYLTGCLALLLMLAAPPLTFALLRTGRPISAESSVGGQLLNPPGVAETAGAQVAVGQMSQIGQMGQPPAAFPPALNPQSAIRNPQSTLFPSLHPEHFLPLFVLAWLLGVSALSLRLLVSSLHVARVKRRGHEPPGAAWLERLDRLKAALQISRPVRLVKSVLVEVPTVAGWLRPVILLPAAALSGLTPAQLETILAHELAHIRRHDYLVNLLQNALETLLFYHPAVWWISSAVRAEREICCDEIAVKICGDRLVHAQALAALEQLRAVRPSLALGADGGSLLERIRRLSGAPAGRCFPGRSRAGGALVAALVALIFISLLHHPSSNAMAQTTLSAVQTGKATSANPQSAIPNPQSDWGEPTNGLRTRLVAEKQQFRAGEPILIRIEVTNTSDQTMKFQIPSAPYFRDSLIVLDSEGSTPPFVGESLQIMTGETNVAPGRTIQLEPFELTEQRYLRRPGSYTVQLPAEPFPMRMPGFSLADLPRSGKLTFEVIADAATDADGDPVGRLLAVLPKKWSLENHGNKIGPLRPGGNRVEATGRALTLYGPTGSRMIANSGAIWLWLTEKPAAELEDHPADTTPASDYLGQAGRFNVYFSPDATALKDWPNAKDDILRALRDGPGGKLPADPASANPKSNAPSAFTGTVLLPNGQPAAGAQVALVVPSYSLYLLHANMHDGGTNPLVVADGEGRFSLPPNASASAIVAMNEAGCAQVERKDFENGLSNITLQPWGRIEGVLRIGTRPGTNQQVVLGAPAGGRFFFELQAFQDRTDLNGKFVFTDVPPGTWLISHSGGSFWDGEPVTVKAGETNRTTIGGTGRPVIGNVLIPAVVTNPPNRAALPPSRWFLAFSNPATNPLFATGSAPEYEVKVTLYTSNRVLRSDMALDGTFRVEDATPGTWWILADVLKFPVGGGTGKTIATMGKTVIVPEMAGGRSDEPLDLGTVEPVIVRSPQIGEAAPPLEIRTVDGKTFKLADHRGQYVLLDFEPLTWKSESNQPDEAVWTSFGKSDRLAMLTLQVPPTSSIMYMPGMETAYSWPFARLQELPWYEQRPLRASYGLPMDRGDAGTNLPIVFLIGPDGKIAAKDLHGDAIKAAVAKALTNK